MGYFTIWTQYVGRDSNMNVFAYPLIRDEVPPSPELTPTKFVVDDNIGEAVHVHLRNFRLEMSVDDFETFAENMEAAEEALDGDR